MTAQADAKQFTALEVFLLTGIPQEKQYQWKDRRVVVPSRRDKLPSGSGDPFLASIETVYQLAITAALAGLGVMAKRAAFAARKFTDHAQPGRAPGECFEHGKTILVIGPDGASVKNVFYDATLADVSNRGVCAITLDLNRVVQTVNETLLQKGLK